MIIRDFQAVAIIPARAGSKGLPGKNTMKLANLPLVAHTIKAALDSGVFEQVIVTSDDENVIIISEELGVTTVNRPAELAGDDVSMALVVRHVLGLDDTIKSEAFALLQPTSPLRTAKHILECSGLYCSGGFRSVVSVCNLDHPPQKALVIEEGELSPLFSWDALNQNRQQLQESYRQNGAIWFVDREAFLKEGRFVIAPAAPYIMNADDSVDIDTADDFATVESIVLARAAAG